jgi:hypothetical protein
MESENRRAGVRGKKVVVRREVGLTRRYFGFYVLGDAT